MAVDLIILPFADQGDKQAPPQVDTSGFVNFTEGYTKYYEISLESGDPQAKAVERNIQNYLFNQLTSATQLWQQMGFSPWFATMPGGYGINAMVMRQETGVWQPYRSLTAGNATDPTGNPASWERIRTWAEISAKIPMPSGGLAGTSELITIATNLNNLATGTYEITTDAIALSSVAPTSPVDTAPRAGMIECKRWSASPGVDLAIQRYVDRNGIEFARGLSGGAWTAWIPQLNLPTQGDLVSYVLDTGIKNALDISTTLSPPLTSRKDGMVLKIKVKVANDGACTIKDNIGTVPLLGVVAPLQGGELAVNGEAWVQWNTSIGAAPGSYLLISSSGAAVQIGPATKDFHALQLIQATGRLIRTITQAIPGTYPYTATPGVTVVDVEGCSGGGGGGGAQATGAGQASAGAGGAGGAYFRKRINASAIPVGATFVVGAGGAGGLGTANGLAGGDTSFAGLVGSSGGGGGNPGGAAAIAGSPTFPTGTGTPNNATLGTADVRASGGVGRSAFYGPSVSMSGEGGASFLGPGGYYLISNIHGSGNGFNSASNGSGGGGALNLSSQGDKRGGEGGDGIITIREYT